MIVLTWFLKQLDGVLTGCKPSNAILVGSLQQHFGHELFVYVLRVWLDVRLGKRDVPVKCACVDGEIWEEFCEEVVDEAVVFEWLLVEGMWSRNWLGFVVFEYLFDKLASHLRIS